MHGRCGRACFSPKPTSKTRDFFDRGVLRGACAGQGPVASMTRMVNEAGLEDRLELITASSFLHRGKIRSLRVFQKTIVERQHMGTFAPDRLAAGFIRSAEKRETAQAGRPSGTKPSMSWGGRFAQIVLHRAEESTGHGLPFRGGRGVHRRRFGHQKFSRIGRWCFGAKIFGEAVECGILFSKKLFTSCEFVFVAKEQVSE